MSDVEKTNGLGEETVDVFIIQAETNPVRLNVNGRAVLIQVGVDSSIPAYFLPSLDNATLRYRLSGDVPEVRGQADRGADDSTPEDDTFDAEAMIAMTIDDFRASVEGNPLTAEQIQKVRDAETDREKPRAGILAILDEATDAQN
jgi:hypothetical protein